uniref:CBM20 domain-containing protein n=1 Tax=Cryptomonas curvata TaxID=233186 RepID=A0A7S0MER2_9CRYP|mmetsp:Transcript_36365/g.76000  ORF Transcript_36365/g.76000 Transcript_36365/m.76000 type:complete len:355 (+) Transcript_36365:126-1190(+)
MINTIVLIAISAVLPVVRTGTLQVVSHGPWCADNNMLPSFTDNTIRRSFSVYSDRPNRLQHSSSIVMHLRGGSSMFKQPRVLSVHDLNGWKNITKKEVDSKAIGPTISVREIGTGQTVGQKGLKRSNSGIKGNGAPFADHERLIEMLRENRQLLQSCKSLRARATDDETKCSLDLRIAELESAWNSYLKVNPAAENWQNVLLRSASDDGKVRLVPVTFRVECNTTKVGDEIVLSGDAEELGNWRESCAVVMRTDPSTFPKWSTTVLLRACECIEYKYAIRRREGEDPAAPGIVVWEGHMGNRGFKVPRRAHLVQDVLIEAEQFTDNWRSPRFLRMHRIDSSELYLEPEYAMVCD